MGSACDLHCQEPSIPSGLTALSLITIIFRNTKGWHLQRKLQSVVLSTLLPMLLPKVVLAFQGHWLKFATVPNLPPCNGGSHSWGLGDPSHSTYPQGTREGANMKVSMTRVKGSWWFAILCRQGGQRGAQHRQLAHWETSAYLL